MLEGDRLRKVENREFAQMISVTSNPDSVVTAAQGTFAWDQTAKALYINTDGATAWERVSVSLPVFHVLFNGAQLTTTTPTPLTGWPVPVLTDSDFFSFNGLTGQLTLLKAGVYMITCHVTGDTTGASRSTLRLQGQTNTGGGFANVAGMLDSQYNFRDATNDIGSAQFTFPLIAGANDIFRLMVFHIGVSNSINTDNARIAAVKIS